MSFYLRPVVATDLYTFVHISTHLPTHTLPLEEVQRRCVQEFHVSVLGNPDFCHTRVVYHTNRGCPLGVIIAHNSCVSPHEIHIVNMLLDGSQSDHETVLRLFLVGLPTRRVSARVPHASMVPVYINLGFQLSTDARREAILRLRE